MPLVEEEYPGPSPQVQDGWTAVEDRGSSSPYTAQSSGREESVDGKFLSGNMRDRGILANLRGLSRKAGQGDPHVTVTWERKSLIVTKGSQSDIQRGGPVNLSGVPCRSEPEEEAHTLPRRRLYKEHFSASLLLLSVWFLLRGVKGLIVPSLIFSTQEELGGHRPRGGSSVGK